MVDKMHYVIAEKTGLLAFKMLFLTIAFMMVIATLPAYLGLEYVPKNIVLLYPGLGLSMAILIISYFLSYLYYSKSRKLIEGR